MYFFIPFVVILALFLIIGIVRYNRSKSYVHIQSRSTKSMFAKDKDSVVCVSLSQLDIFIPVNHYGKIITINNKKYVLGDIIKIYQQEVDKPEEEKTFIFRISTSIDFHSKSEDEEHHIKEYTYELYSKKEKKYLKMSTVFKVEKIQRS